MCIRQWTELRLPATRPAIVALNSQHQRLNRAMLRCTTIVMRIAIVDESATRAAVIREGLAAFEDCELFVLTERRGLVASIGEIAPDIVLIDLGNPSRDVLEEYFAVSRALARPIAMFVDESDDEALAASIDAGVSSYVVDGMAPHRIRPILDLAVRRFNAFARLQSDLAEAQGKLAERDAIDRAKRILMDSRKITEPQAYAELRKTAMNQGRRISEIAEAVVTAHELMGGI
jgi:two-component system, response regulator / RNA-binding antiterminator